MAQPLGFDASQRLTLSIAVPTARYKTPEERHAVLLDIERRLGALPGVRSVGAVNLLPLAGGDSRTGIGFESREPKPDDPPTRMHPRIVTPRYFPRRWAFRSSRAADSRRPTTPEPSRS